MLGIGAVDARTSKQVGLVLARIHAVVVEHFADLDAAIEQCFAGSLNVGDDQVHTLRRAGCRRGGISAKDDRGPGTRRSELDHAEVFTIVEVGVESPPKLLVELFRTIHIRDRDNHDLELHVHWRDAGFDSTDGVRAHSCLLTCAISLSFFVIPATDATTSYTSSKIISSLSGFLWVAACSGYVRNRRLRQGSPEQ